MTLSHVCRHKLFACDGADRCACAVGSSSKTRRCLCVEYRLTRSFVALNLSLYRDQTGDIARWGCEGTGFETVPSYRLNWMLCGLSCTLALNSLAPHLGHQGCLLLF
jgi:hypothetical protein